MCIFLYTYILTIRAEGPGGRRRPRLQGFTTTTNNDNNTATTTTNTNNNNNHNTSAGVHVFKERRAAATNAHTRI